jgi:hypothetical protein
MAYLSPLFQSSLELFAHSIEHYNCGKEKDRKFVILHLANAVELIFKDLLLDLGESIYKNPKETISITHAIDTLTKQKSITIPQFNKLELLIDERNSLQHRYGFPNELTIIFYMEAAYGFFNEFLKDNYDLDVDSVLQEFLSEKELEKFTLRNPSNINELDKLLKLAREHPIGALLSVYAYLEKQLNEIKDIIYNALPEKSYRRDREIRMRTMRFSSPDFLPKLLKEYEIDLSENEVEELYKLRQLRNQTAHGREEPTFSEVKSMIETIRRIEPSFIDLKEKVKEKPFLMLEDLIEKIEAENPSLFTQ